MALFWIGKSRFLNKRLGNSIVSFKYVLEFAVSDFLTKVDILDYGLGGQSDGIDSGYLY